MYFRRNNSREDSSSSSAVVKRRGRPRDADRIQHQFHVGDLVWGKISPHPWWPGMIYNESHASPDTLSAKKHPSCLAVFLYGDSTHGWIKPARLRPFEERFPEMYDEFSDYDSYQKAVQEALEELKKRSLLGFICRCHTDQSAQKDISDQENKLFEVEFGGFMNKGIYSGGQMKKAREALQPEDLLGFLQKLAVNPRNVGAESADRISLITNTAQLQFFKHHIRSSKLNQQEDLSLALPQPEAGEQSMDYVWGNASSLPKGRRRRRLPKKPRQSMEEPSRAETSSASDQLQPAPPIGSASEPHDQVVAPIGSSDDDVLAAPIEEPPEAQQRSPSLNEKIENTLEKLDVLGARNKELNADIEATGAWIAEYRRLYGL